MAVSFRECTLEDLEILQAFSRRLFFETFADMNTPENMAVYLDKAFAAEKTPYFIFCTGVGSWLDT